MVDLLYLVQIYYYTLDGIPAPQSCLARLASFKGGY